MINDEGPRGFDDGVEGGLFFDVPSIILIFLDEASFFLYDARDILW